MVGELKAEIGRLMESLACSLPDECATYFVEEDASATGGGTIFSLTPWQDKAAAIVLNVVGIELTLIVGKGSRFEFFASSPEKRARVLREVAQICEAVISGGLSETIWTKGSETVRVDGVVKLDGSSRSTSSRKLSNPFSRRSKTVVAYSPYCALEDLVTCPPEISSS